MSQKTNPEKKILLDSDVIRHLIKADRLSLLFELYNGRLVLLDVVKKELLRSNHLVLKVSNFIKYSHLEEVPFPTERIEILKEFASLKKRFGDGESACMAVARYADNIIASSNLRDIATYCSRNSIEYITTMDILQEGFENDKLTKVEADTIIKTIKQKNSKLPVDSLDEYINMKKY